MLNQFLGLRRGVQRGAQGRLPPQAGRQLRHQHLCVQRQGGGPQDQEALHQCKVMDNFSYFYCQIERYQMENGISFYLISQSKLPINNYPFRIPRH